MVEEEDPFLFNGPSYLLDFGVEVVVPPLSALFANASG
jgi:hypothetical protein